MVSVLHKELEYTVEKLQVQEVGGRAAKDKKKSQLPVGEYKNIPDQSTQSFIVVID